MRGLLAAVAAITMLPSAANAAEFVNGSFETGVPAGSFTTVAGGNGASITGWTVTGSSVDYIGSYWTAQNGSHSIDLNGSAQGGIQQTFDTLAGIQYNVTFWLAGNPDGAPLTKNVLVSATGATNGEFSFNSTGTSKTNMGWSKYTYNFLAAGPSTTLSFASQDAGAFGAALDNVSVAAVPEPATWALMLIGFAGVGFSMRRRSSTVRGVRYA
ncbi:choice-of-anchor C family protein [Sphingopyxis sp.]|uniref:choice-of-anchor C family PEP-CTERM protein n=1 Tax=Sphingopyxis sp. TaxID=1908224 RepID=UPI0025D0304A|nr:choice-of-anchor C family protein [Sphingopyxis sp.]MBK6414283.1 choice-of-anchor C family protein [Sphingopyxis sp.]